MFSVKEKFELIAFAAGEALEHTDATDSLCGARDGEARPSWEQWFTLRNALRSIVQMADNPPIMGKSKCFACGK